MAVNLFSSPADNQFISQYVQLPIQDMYNLGQIAQTEYEKALGEQTNAVSQYSQFNSTPEINNIFQKLTYDRLNDVANEASEQGIDALRDPVFRGRIRSTIRQIAGDPRVKSLYTSAQNIAERNKMAQQMIASGQLNPNEDPYGGVISHWDPTRQGTFTDTTINPYQSWQQLSVPIDEFLKTSKDNYLKTDGFYDIYGPDENKYKQLSSGIAKNLMSDPRVQNKFLGSARTFAQGQGLNVDDNTALNIYSKVLSAELGKENASKSDILHHYIQKSLDNEYSNLLTTSRKVNEVKLKQWEEGQENYRAKLAHQQSGGFNPTMGMMIGAGADSQAMILKKMYGNDLNSYAQWFTKQNGYSPLFETTPGKGLSKSLPDNNFVKTALNGRGVYDVNGDDARTPINSDPGFAITFRKGMGTIFSQSGNMAIPHNYVKPGSNKIWTDVKGGGALNPNDMLDGKKMILKPIGISTDANGTQYVNARYYVNIQDIKKDKRYPRFYNDFLQTSGSFKSLTDRHDNSDRDIYASNADKPFHYTKNIKISDDKGKEIAGSDDIMAGYVSIPLNTYGGNLGLFKAEQEAQSKNQANNQYNPSQLVSSGFGNR